MHLYSPVTDISGVGPEIAAKLNKLNIFTVYDLLHHIPSRYVDYSNISNFTDIKINEPVTVEGQIISFKNIFTKTGKNMQQGEISNGQDTLTVVWFNQRYLQRTLQVGTNVALTGKISFWGKKRALFSPQYEIIRDGEGRLHSGKIVAIYPETAGINSKWLRRTIDKVLKNQIKDFLPSSILTENNFLNITESFSGIHQPKNESDIEISRTRLAFNELIVHTYSQLERRNRWIKNSLSKKFTLDKRELDLFRNSLPFSLTNSQLQAIDEVLMDLKQEQAMNRLLEGDVGSGKTVVAAFAAFVSFKNKASSVIMAPTQLLSEQHYNSLTKLLSPFNIPVTLVTSKNKALSLTSRAVYVGTHALLFNYPSEVGLVVIDEQHRFGVKQRATISQTKEVSIKQPHTLTMTATPIPRTIALTLYGDLDISTLKEMPKGRKIIKTWVVPEEKRKGAYKWIENEIKGSGSQAFIVCPLIEESNASSMKEVKVVKTEYLRLKKIFKRLNVSLLHGKMRPKEKTKVLDDFRNKKIDILVTTQVVEVGIDIPNATIMMIESSDRFGLAALHQLRGRVGRGEKQSYCLLFTESKSKAVLDKLTAMSKTMSGRDLAELDLSLRGPGEIFGTRQSGLPELTIARWTDIDLIKKAKEVAEQIAQKPHDFTDLLSHLKKLQTIAN